MMIASVVTLSGELVGMRGLVSTCEQPGHKKLENGEYPKIRDRLTSDNGDGER